MKLRINNYIFDASNKQITFTDYSSIDLDGVLLITNVTDNIIIYNFAAPGFGGTVIGNVLTLDYDTTSMSDSDNIQLFYDDSIDINSLITMLQTQISNDNDMHRQLLQLLKPLGITVSGTGRLQLDINNVVGGTIGTVTNITNLPTLANVTTVGTVSNIGGLNGFDLQYNMAHMSYADSLRNKLTF